MSDPIYSFAFRGLLADAALDLTDRLRRAGLGGNVDEDIARRLPLHDLDEDLVSRAARMAPVYISIAAFENSVRDFVSKRLLEEVGAEWWEKCVSEGIRKRADSRREEEKKIRWHSTRGDNPLSYTEFGELASVVAQNWQYFEFHLQSQEWVRQIIATLEKSRNVLMHSGELALDDVERVGTAIRDWVRQVGA